MLCRVIDKSGSWEAMRASCKSLRTQLENDVLVPRYFNVERLDVHISSTTQLCRCETSSSDGSVVFDKPHVYYGMGT